jgi:hypothetical protein
MFIYSSYHMTIGVKFIIIIMEVLLWLSYPMIMALKNWNLKMPVMPLFKNWLLILI